MVERLVSFECVDSQLWRYCVKESVDGLHGIEKYERSKTGFSDL